MHLKGGNICQHQHIKISLLSNTKNTAQLKKWNKGQEMAFHIRRKINGQLRGCKY